MAARRILAGQPARKLCSHSVKSPACRLSQPGCRGQSGIPCEQREWSSPSFGTASQHSRQLHSGYSPSAGLNLSRVGQPSLRAGDCRRAGGEVSGDCSAWICSYGSLGNGSTYGGEPWVQHLQAGRKGLAQVRGQVSISGRNEQSLSTTFSGGPPRLIGRRDGQCGRNARAACRGAVVVQRRRRSQNLEALFSLLPCGERRVRRTLEQRIPPKNREPEGPKQGSLGGGGILPPKIWMPRPPKTVW